MSESLRFTTDTETVTPAALAGFFIGWPNPPSTDQHHAILRSSQLWAETVTIDDARDRLGTR